MLINNNKMLGIKVGIAVLETTTLLGMAEF